MSKAKHTPGPWPYEYTGDSKRIIVGKGLVDGPNGYEVAEVYSDDCGTEEALANARLIAAAPDMLAALKDAKFFIDSIAMLRGIKEAAGYSNLISEAIDKAEGI